MFNVQGAYPQNCMAESPRNSISRAANPIPDEGEEETKSVFAVAKKYPRAGSRLVEAVADPGAEESVAPPNAFPGEIRASAMSKAGGKYKAANDIRIPNLGHVCGLGFQIADVERALIAVSHLAAARNGVTFKAQGGEIENIKTGRKITLVTRGGMHVFRTWVAARFSGFPGLGS